MNFSEHRGVSILVVPGLGNSGPQHWQTLWTNRQPDTSRVELGMWNAPRRNAWVTKLDQAIHAAHAPVVLVAHSLGCLAVAWWAALATQPWGWPVAGALLVAPPDLTGNDHPHLAAEFGPHPKLPLPFPSILVASRNDAYADPDRAFDMAKDWGSQFVDAGALGHLNAASGLGTWREGEALLDILVEVASEDTAPDTLGHAQTIYDEAFESAPSVDVATVWGGRILPH